jgi:ribosomal protein S18 acetylase RimI-like enzyme
VRGVQIRPALPADLEKLTRTFGPFLGHAYAERARQAGAVLVGVTGRAAVAAVFVSTGPPDEAEIVDRIGRVPMLHRLNVAAGYRRRGVGTQMIDAAERMLRAAGCSRLAVGVDLENDGAARLYRRLGYREWPYGLLKTFREHGDEAGNVLVTPDECRLFVKELPPDGRRLFA